MSNFKVGDVIRFTNILDDVKSYSSQINDDSVVIGVIHTTTARHGYDMRCNITVFTSDMQLVFHDNSWGINVDEVKPVLINGTMNKSNFRWGKHV